MRYFVIRYEILTQKTDVLFIFICICSYFAFICVVFSAILYYIAQPEIEINMDQIGGCLLSVEESCVTGCHIHSLPNTQNCPSFLASNVLSITSSGLSVF